MGSEDDILNLTMKADCLSPNPEILGSLKPSNLGLKFLSYALSVIETTQTHGYVAGDGGNISLF